ncbi:MAG TPA: YggS family pyridoxal phosphate-dependent enzyme, partial [Usitatibacteraceae bacterium]|nr:YggS family pyridoxal phosphate-dependent enzyme [Usitatibacteraceae bacterium]
MKSAIRAAIAGSAVSREVNLVAVSKARSVDEIRAAFHAGQRDFGENYVQEALPKLEALAGLRREGLVWHFLGPIQSNKAGDVAAGFDWAHGVDREKIAEALSRRRSGPPLNVCIEVNVSGEPGKHGVTPSQVRPLAQAVARLPNLKLRGLMTLIEQTGDEAEQRRQFRRLREQFDLLRAEGMAVDTLSMGMSGDFPA